MLHACWEVECIYNMVGKLERKMRHVKDLDVDGQIILKWILKKLYERMWNIYMYIYETKDRAILDACEHRPYKMLAHYFIT